MLVKLPVEGCGVRYVDKDLVKVIHITTERKTQRDALTYLVQLIDANKSMICEIACETLENAENLADAIAVICYHGE